MGTNGYDNPVTGGSSSVTGAHGEPQKKAPAGSKPSGYDNTPNTTKAKTDGTTAKPAGGGGSSSGYDNIKKDQDYGFSGTPKKRSPNI
jgi:hypothetical protein